MQVDNGSKYLTEDRKLVQNHHPCLERMLLKDTFSPGGRASFGKPFPIPQWFSVSLDRHQRVLSTR